MKKMILIGLALCSVASVAKAANDSVNQIKTVDNIDITKYMGKWYEVAHLPNYFQRKCSANTAAEYSLNQDKTVKVLNSCQNKNGNLQSSQGLAKSINDGNSKLKVSFMPKGLQWVPFTKGDYWILRIDPEYKVALVGGPSKKYLWILSRTPHIDETTYVSYLETAKNLGYDTHNLIKTIQN
ncbi:MAG: Outer membrane lipoprotein Blc [Acinetobacter bereziniae]|uniref:Outer membrane lipoprotein Blc n=1 Tax=Acinetobacter bereziniae TaxID=106648 RepID=A0A833PFZ4_ACIBZ|nr:MAG: Outer membrane lipoprotein Blc [Acinetobacter bereziniae]